VGELYVCLVRCVVVEVLEVLVLVLVIGAVCRAIPVALLRCIFRCIFRFIFILFLKSLFFCFCSAGHMNHSLLEKQRRHMHLQQQREHGGGGSGDSLSDTCSYQNQSQYPNNLHPQSNSHSHAARYPSGAVGSPTGKNSRLETAEGLGLDQEHGQEHENGLENGHGMEEGGFSPGILRNPSYYSKAWQQRQQLGSGRGSRNNLLQLAQEQQELEEAAAAASAVSAGPASHRRLLPHQLHHSMAGIQYPVSFHNTAKALRRILEDYLEVDSTANPRLRELLRPELLVTYFKRMKVPSEEILFDTDMRADKVQWMQTISGLFVSFKISVSLNWFTFGSSPKLTCL
jgi:hypothetical protein